MGWPGPVRMWCGAGGFVAPEVTDLRTNVASAKKGVEGVHNVFLVSPDSGFAFGAAL